MGNAVHGEEKSGGPRMGEGPSSPRLQSAPECVPRQKPDAMCARTPCQKWQCGGGYLNYNIPFCWAVWVSQPRGLAAACRQAAWATAGLSGQGGGETRQETWESCCCGGRRAGGCAAAGDAPQGEREAALSSHTGRERHQGARRHLANSTLQISSSLSHSLSLALHLRLSPSPSHSHTHSLSLLAMVLLRPLALFTFAASLASVASAKAAFGEACE